MGSFDEYDYLEAQIAQTNGHPSSGKERHTSRERERERDRKRDRESDKDRVRDSERERDRDSRHKSRDRRERERDYPEGQRRRSRSRDRHRSHREDPREYRERDHRGPRHRSRSPPRRKRDATPPEVRLQREKERELAELERATRTVFAYNLNIKADERDIYEFFSKAGEVMDIRLITDRHTKRSKGLAYVEYAKQEQVFLSLALSGQIMMGQPVMVKPAEAEKNLAWEAQQAAKQNAADVSNILGVATGDFGLSADLPMKLQVTGFKAGLGEAELRQIFEPFGVVDAVSLVRDATGQPVGIGYVVFRSGVAAQTAMQHWDGNMLLDSVLNVTVAPLAPAEGGPTTTVGELDEDEDNFKLNSQARAALMSRLAGSAGLAAPAPGMVPGMVPGGLPAVPAAMDPNLLVEQGRLGPPSPIPTPCLLLKGMFTPSQQTEPNWVQEVTEDVRDECSKFGQLLHVHVDPESRGFVYLKFAAVESAQAAHKVLHGRFYMGNQILADYQFVQIYNTYFQL